MGIIGAPLDRKDGKAKVTGRAHYAAEAAVPGVVHAELVQSTISAGMILAVETDTAKAMPGVLAIMTPDNAPRLKPVKPAMQVVTRPGVAGPVDHLQRPACRGRDRRDAGAGAGGRGHGAGALPSR